MPRATPGENLAERCGRSAFDGERGNVGRNDKNGQPFFGQGTPRAVL